MRYSRTFYNSQSEGSRTSASHTVPILMDLISPGSVVDVGCGLGTWLAEFRAAGVGEILGVDGDYCKDYDLHIPKSNFISADLYQSSLSGKIPGLDGNRIFSLCISLETAEHLPEECADAFVCLLVSLSNIVLFSAAIPHQGGSGHVNEQWSTYWIDKFTEHGYVASDIVRALTWGNTDIKPWYRQNMILFFKKSVYAKYQDRINVLMSTCGNENEYLSKVHPDFYLMCVEYYHSKEFLSTIKSSALFLQLMERANEQFRKRFLSLPRRLFNRFKRVVRAPSWE